MKTNKFLVYSITFMLILGFLSNFNVTAKPIENQTMDIIYIYNVYDLQNMSNNLSGSYELGNNIDANITTTWNGGAGFIPIGTVASPFTGTFNGNNYTINYLFMNRSSNGAGLFGTISNTSSVTNVILENASVNGYSAVAYLGCLVGGNAGGYIDNCHVSGDIFSNINFVGGLVGYNQGYIFNSSSNVTIICNGLSGIYHGGFVGVNTIYYYMTPSEDYIFVQGTGLIKYCFSLGSVIGSACVGGFCGENTQNISDCYSQADVIGLNILNVVNAYISGFVGRNNGYINNSYSTGEVTDYYDQITRGFTNNLLIIYGVYYDTETSGETDIGNGTTRTTEEMMSESTFIGWDFDSVWEIDEGVSYPYFKWSAPEGMEEPTEEPTEEPIEEITFSDTIVIILMAIIPILIIIAIFKSIFGVMEKSITGDKKE